METVIRILLLVLALLFLGGCGLGDWEYELIGGYAIVRCNSEDILLTHREAEDAGGTVVLPNCRVTAACTNDRYIGIQAIRYKGLAESDKGILIGESAFYLVDAINHEVYGPFASQTEYDAKCSELSAGDMELWRTTEELAAAAYQQKRKGE